MSPRRLRRRLRLCAGMLGLSLLVAGCMPAPRSAPPLAQVRLPADWRAPLPQQSQEAAPQLQWWRSFGDARLDALVEQALAHNSDLLAAGARLDEARANWRLADAARKPALNAALGVQGSRSLEVIGIEHTHAIEPLLQASWEVDLWGRLREQARAGDLRVQAGQAERDGVALAVASATAQAYIGLLSLEAQLRSTEATAASRAEALRLASDQASVGYISKLQLTQAQSEYEAVQGALPQLRLALRRQEQGLTLLLGEAPGTVTRGTGDFAALRPPAVPALLPSALLERRPDLARSALLLAASDVNLAVRRAAFLPQLNLAASLGKLYVSALEYDPVRVWSIGGSVLAPLFSAGRLDAQYDAATAQRDQAAYAYRAAVLGAFAEVENALAGVTELRAQMDHAQRRRDILARSLEYAHDRYQAGYASYLEELDAQRNLYQLELDLIRLRQSELENLIALHRALGGGWSSTALAIEQK